MGYSDREISKRPRNTFDTDGLRFLGLLLFRGRIQRGTKLFRGRIERGLKLFRGRIERGMNLFRGRIERGLKLFRFNSEAISIY